MKVRNIINNYVNDNELKITIYENNKINIINYDNIIDFNSKNVEIKVKDKIINVNGLNLTINKMLNDEILIEGLISEIRIN